MVGVRAVSRTTGKWISKETTERFQHCGHLAHSHWFLKHPSKQSVLGKNKLPRGHGEARCLGNFYCGGFQSLQVRKEWRQSKAREGEITNTPDKY